MTTKVIIAMLISFVVGILAGRFSTYYRLYRAQALVEDSGELLDKVKEIREELKRYEELEGEGINLRKNDSE